MTLEDRFDLWEQLDELHRDTPPLKELYECPAINLMSHLFDELDEAGFMEVFGE